MNIEIPPGYGLRILPKAEWASADLEDPTSYEEHLLNNLIIWEAPQKDATYTVGVDVALGIAQDRSVITVLRNPTLHLPAEEVAQFISDSVDPVSLASYIDPIGRFYHDSEENGALVAIEINGLGFSTQAELQGHLGYTNFYVWQKFDIRDPRRRFSNSFGWATTMKTRAALIGFIKKAVETVDPVTGAGDIIVNSPFTLSEIRSFQVSPGDAAWQAHAAQGAHDDALMALMIAAFVAHMERYSEVEPLNEQRRRIHEEKLRTQFKEEVTGMRADFQNTACSVDQMYSNDYTDLNEWEKYE